MADFDINDMFNEWEKEVDWEGLNKDVEEAEQNGYGSYKDVPHGTYEVSIEKMEMTASKSKREPMLSIWFKVVAGEFKDSRIFYNQVVQNPTGIHFACETLRNMGLACVTAAGHSDHQLFRNPRQFNSLLMDAAEEIDSNNLTFELEYGEGKKGYSTYKIVGAFEN